MNSEWSAKRWASQGRPKWKSLRVQTGLVVTILFVFLIGLWYLLAKELVGIRESTGRLALAAETGDQIAKWKSALGMSMRERAKFTTLQRESFLQSWLEATSDLADCIVQIRSLEPKEIKFKEELVERFISADLEYRNRAVAFSSIWLQTVQSEQLGILQTLPQRKLNRESPPPEKKDAFYWARDPRPWERLAHEKFGFLEFKMRDLGDEVEQALREERSDRQKALVAATERAFNRIFLSLMLITMLVIYVAVILKWRILDPLKSLQSGAKAVGEGNLGHLVPTEGGLEIANLAQAFNEMSVRLESNQKTELQLKQLEVVRQVVRSVNHQINNPLMAISGNAELLLESEHNLDASARKRVEAILTESHRIFTVTQQLKKIREPITEEYLDDGDRMIKLEESNKGEFLP